MKTLLFSAIQVLLAASVGAQQTFTVDADGPADFAEITQAIASPLVADGDTLLVAPGLYSSFVLDKALDVLAYPGKSFWALSITVDGAQSFSLVGAGTYYLDVRHVPGGGLIDRCGVIGIEFDDGSGSIYYVGRTRIEDSVGILLQRSLFRGGDACYPNGPSSAHDGVSIDDSVVVIADSTLTGGDPAPDNCPQHYLTVGAGLNVLGQSDVLVTGCSLTAGALHTWGFGRSALEVAGSRVTVRGNSAHTLTAYAPYLAVALDANSTVRVSGVLLDPTGLPAGVLSPVPSEPFLWITGGEALGSVVTVNVFGPPGAAALLGIGFRGAPLYLPPTDDNLWLDPTGALVFLPMTTLGQEILTSFTFSLPMAPSLVGRGLVFQTWVNSPWSSGPWLTNPAELVVGQ